MKLFSCFLYIFLFSSLLICLTKANLSSSASEYNACGSKNEHEQRAQQDMEGEYETESSKKCQFFSEDSFCDLSFNAGVCVCEDEKSCMKNAGKNCTKMKYDKLKVKECPKICKTLDSVAFLCQNPKDKRKYCVCVSG